MRRWIGESHIQQKVTFELMTIQNKAVEGVDRRCGEDTVEEAGGAEERLWSRLPAWYRASSPISLCMPYLIP